MDEKLVEAVAISLAEFDGRYWCDMAPMIRTKWKKRARAAIDAIHSYKHLEPVHSLDEAWDQFKVANEKRLKAISPQNLEDKK